MKLAHMEEDWEPPDPESGRYLNESVIPIAAGVKAVNEKRDLIVPKRVPLTPRQVVEAIHKVKEKKRSEFDSQLEYDIHRQLLRIQREADAEVVRELNSLNLEEAQDSDPVKPLAGADAVQMDERARLDAYLAHYNPCGWKIHTVDAYVDIGDESYRAPKRQDHILREEVVVEYPLLYRPRFVVETVYNSDGKSVGTKILRDRDGNQRCAGATEKRRNAVRKKATWRQPYGDSGVVFWLTGDREADRNRALRRTRKSRARRAKLGKAEGTRYQNLATIGSYRPTPSVQWFIEHPSGKGVLYDTPFPSGRVELDAEAKMEHARRESEWVNAQKYCAQTAATLLKNGFDSSDIVRDLMVIGERQEYTHQWLRRAHASVDDLPWGPASPEDSIDLAKETGAYPPSEVMPSLPTRPTPERESTEAEAESVVTMSHPATEETEDSNQSVLEGTVILVNSAGETLPPTRVANREVLTQLASWLSGKPQDLKDQEVEATAVVSADLTDTRYLPVIRQQVDYWRERVAKDTEHLENLVKAKMILEHRLGVHSDANETADQIWNQLDWDVERIRVCTAKDLGLPEDRAKVKPARGFSKLLRTIERVEKENEERVDQWWDAYCDRVDRIARGRVQMIQIRRQNRMRIPLEREALRNIWLKNLLRRETKRRAAEKVEHLNKLSRLRIPAEIRWLRSQAKPGRWKRLMEYKLQKKQRYYKWKLRTMLKQRSKPVMATPPRVEPERPTNIQPRAVPTFHYVPQKQDEESALILPKVKVIEVSEIDRRLLEAYRKKLLRSGRFGKEEIEQADQIFKPRMAVKAEAHRSQRAAVLEEQLVA